MMHVDKIVIYLTILLADYLILLGEITEPQTGGREDSCEWEMVD